MDMRLMLLVKAYIILALMKCQVVAPGQQDPVSPLPDPLCLGERFRGQLSYPGNWHLLFDSYHYQNLLDSSSTGSASPVWTRRDVDGTGEQWIQGPGGICRQTIHACTYQTPSQDNWVFTQYIRYEQAIEVHIYANVRLMNECQANQSCNEFVTVYRFDTNTPNSAQRVDTENYRLADNHEMYSRLQMQNETATVYVGFTRPSAYTGFYLGLRDNGTCGSVNRLKVYYKVARSFTDGLLSCPEVPINPVGTSNVTCSCAENAGTLESLERVCREYECSSPGCSCSPGYELNQTTTTCQACQAGMFKSEFSNTTLCTLCPANSIANDTAATVCECIPPYTRDPPHPGRDCIDHQGTSEVTSTTAVPLSSSSNRAPIIAGLVVGGLLIFILLLLAVGTAIAYICKVWIRKQSSTTMKEHIISDVIHDNVELNSAYNVLQRGTSIETACNTAYGVCEQHGVTLLPQTSWTVPSNNTQIAAESLDHVPSIDEDGYEYII